MSYSKGCCFRVSHDDQGSELALETGPEVVSEKGHGNCLTNSKHSQHNGDKICYVQMPSRCQDLVASVANPGDFFSEEACKMKGLSFH